MYWGSYTVAMNVNIIKLRLVNEIIEKHKFCYGFSIGKYFFLDSFFTFYYYFFFYWNLIFIRTSNHTIHYRFILRRSFIIVIQKRGGVQKDEKSQLYYLHYVNVYIPIPNILDRYYTENMSPKREDCSDGHEYIVMCSVINDY